MAILETEVLTKRFNSLIAVNNLTIAVEAIGVWLYPNIVI